MSGPGRDESLPERFAARMGQLLGPDFPDRIGLAVSGGGDSMAMLALAHDWARVWGIGLRVVTVDHGLRPGSAAEAETVAAECARLGHPHDTLVWSWDGNGNLQDAARRARLALIDRWRDGIAHVLYAHTLDDVAETLLMRLARGSGVDGLSAMAEKRHVPPRPEARLDGRQDGFWQLRPLLCETRVDLRHHVDTLRVPYVDDPSNEDPRFERARVRQALDALQGLGIRAQGLAETAARMSRAREALQARAAQVAEGLLRPTPEHTGQLLFDRDRLASVERETQLRLLAAALQWVSGAPYRPRAAPLEALLDRALAGGGGTLHVAQVDVERDNLRIFREYQAVRDAAAPTGAGVLWDGAWVVKGVDIDGLTTRALGPGGWAAIPEKPADAPTYAAALSLPAVFDGARLVACRALAFGPSHEVTALRPARSFVAFLQLR